MFVNEALLISEEITEHGLWTLLEISHKFSSKVNVFKLDDFAVLAYNILENFITELYHF